MKKLCLLVLITVRWIKVLLAQNYLIFKNNNQKILKTKTKFFFFKITIYIFENSNQQLTAKKKIHCNNQ